MPINEETKGRIDAFMQEYGQLIEKYKVDFIAYPVWIPDGNGAFKMVIQQQPVDTTGRGGIKSPDEFVPKA